MPRWRTAILCVALFVAGGAVTTLASHTTEAPTFAGCLDTATGSLTKLQKGYVPLTACAAGEVRVHLSGGDVTSVFPTSGGGLKGGGEDGNIQIALDFPQTDARWINERQANSVTSAMITTAAVQTFDLKNNDVASIDIKDNDVASIDIADGTIADADVANGSITTGKLDPSVAFALTGPTPLPLGNATSAATAIFANDTASNQYVHVTGQANITCTCGPGESISVAWFLFETSSGTVLGSQYADSISGDGGAGERTIVATIDRVVSLAPGTHSISLHVVPQNTSGFGTPADPTSIAADLAVIGIGAAP